jgi:invasion protein IalB
MTIPARKMGRIKVKTSFRIAAAAMLCAMLAPAAVRAIEPKKPLRSASDSAAAAKTTASGTSASGTSAPGNAAPTAAQDQPPAANPAPVPGPAPKIVRTESLVYDSWTVNCAYGEQADAKPTCSAILRIAEKVNNVPRVVFTWLISRQNSGLVSVLSVPTGIRIEPGAEVKFGDGAPRKYGYSLCAPNRCEVTIAMDPAVTSEMQRAPTTEVTIVGMTGQNARFSVNMKGIDRALAAIGK